jgi:hypothetical protein
MVGELLRVPGGPMTHQWHDIVTLDESWVCLDTEHELMCVPPGETAPDRERQTTQSPRLMLTMVWNPIGFHAVKSLPKRTKFNAQYHVDNILVGISDWRRGAGETRPEKP